jgi:hypothetical protein
MGVFPKAGEEKTGIGSPQGIHIERDGQGQGAGAMGQERDS